MVIRAGDRVAHVLRQDPALVDVFAAAAPAFERLRNPLMRRTMARLVTVEQAARIAGIDAGSLIARLNLALGAGGDAGPAGPSPDAGHLNARTGTTMTSPTREPAPAAVRAVDPDRIVDLDVRDELRAGREPFSLIMKARRSLGAGDVFRLRAIFEPVPLYQVMARQGFEHWTERLAEDDWRVWFYVPEAGAAAGAGAPSAVAASAAGVEPAASGTESQPDCTAVAQGTGEAANGDGDVVVLDVRGLEPPEPMARTLAALERLPAGATLIQINVRVPQFLLPQLEERGFGWEIREQSPELVRLFIRRRADG